MAEKTSFRLRTLSHHRHRFRTKVICTIGPASNDYDTLHALYKSGMSVVRINMSHASYEEAMKTIQWIKTLNRKIRYPIPIILDTQGPEIRTGVLARSMKLEQGMRVILVRERNPRIAGEIEQIEIGYEGLSDSVADGDTVRIDNGLINLSVESRDQLGIVCRVLDGGELGSRKHVNLPGVHVNLPTITPKDKADIEFGLENDIDFVAQSFVRSSEDIHAMREILGGKNNVKVIAKIENQEGVANAPAIATVADGIMVARGDLGIETDISGLPNLQRELVQTTIRAGRRCIVATHLLESMVEHPIPTRAEVTDVANAIYEGVDGVMLSAETSISKYPVRAVEQIMAIAEASERFPDLGFSKSLHTNSTKQYLARSAVELAERVGAAGIVVITRRGITADLVSNCAPTGVPIFAFTNHSQTRRRLMLNRGVYSHRTAFSSNPEKTIQTALDVLHKREELSEEAYVVVISDVLADGPVDSVQLRKIDLH